MKEGARAEEEDRKIKKREKERERVIKQSLVVK